MKCNFDAALAAVLVHEGGYVNHPRDPGGATNRGVTQKVYDAYRAKRGLALRSVKSITAAEVSDIYRYQYWDAVKGDELPGGVDYCVFDFAVNSGVSRAAKYLQSAVGAVPDGQIGLATLAAIGCKAPSEIVGAICDARLGFLRRLPIFNTFGKGWTRRVNDVRAAAVALT